MIVALVSPGTRILKIEMPQREKEIKFLLIRFPRFLASMHLLVYVASCRCKF